MLSMAIPVECLTRSKDDLLPRGMQPSKGSAETLGSSISKVDTPPARRTSNGNVHPKKVIGVILPENTPQGDRETKQKSAGNTCLT